MQIPVVRESDVNSDEDLEWACAGLQDSLDACAKDWGLESDAVVYYGTEPVDYDLASIGRAATIVDSMPEAPGADAYHTDDNGTIYTKCLSSKNIDDVSVALDHENKEELVDPHCDKTATMPDGRLLDVEICDHVQGDVRYITATIGDQTRQVAYSNHVTPNYFKADAPPPYDAFGLVTKPFECRPGGYQMITDPKTGDRAPVFGDEAWQRAYEAKKANPTSRLNRRAP